MGRKPISIPPRQLRKLVEAGWTEAQICDFFGCAVGFLNHAFPNVLKRGRPAVRITEEMLRQVEKLSSFMCTEEEIFSFMNVSKSTWQKLKINPDFSAAFKKGRNQGRVSLRSKQYAVALAGNPTLLIWLGKQYLDQDDRQKIEMNTGGGGVTFCAVLEEPKCEAEWHAAAARYKTSSPARENPE